MCLNGLNEQQTLKTNVLKSLSGSADAVSCDHNSQDRTRARKLVRRCQSRVSGAFNVKRTLLMSTQIVTGGR